MPTKNEEQALFDHLQTLTAFGEMGLTAVFGDRGEIIIARRGHVRGIWHCDGPMFAWTPTGYGKPIQQVADVEAAISYTRDVIMATSRTVF